MVPVATRFGADELRNTTRLALWVRGARPRTLTLSSVPVLVGNALAAADDGYRLGIWVLAATLCAAALIQAATNLYNDAFDGLRGVDDNAVRLGPPRLVATGRMSAGDVLTGAHGALAFAFLLGVFLVLSGGWPILVVGLASLVAAYTYSAGSRPISGRPTAEVYVVVFFGIVAVVGSYYLQSGGISAEALVAGLSLGFAAAAVLLVNNYRDLETDRAGGRRTVVVAWGRPVTRVLYVVLLALSLALCAGIAIRGVGVGWGFLPLLLVPWAFQLSRSIGTRAGADLNGVLFATVGFHLVLGALLSVGALLSSGGAS